MRLLCTKSPIEVTPMIIEVQSGRQNYQLVTQLWSLWAPFGFLFAQNGIRFAEKGRTDNHWDPPNGCQPDHWGGPNGFNQRLLHYFGTHFDRLRTSNEGGVRLHYSFCSVYITKSPEGNDCNLDKLKQIYNSNNSSLQLLLLLLLLLLLDRLYVHI